MLVLQEFKFLLKLLGLEPYSDSNQVNRLNAICYLVSLFLNVLMSSGYFIENIHVLKEASDSMTVLFGFFITFTYTFHFLYNRDQFRSFEQELHDIVKDSMCSLDTSKKEAELNFEIFTGIEIAENDKLYAHTEERVTFYTRISIKATALMCTMAIVPFLRVVYHLCSGNYTLHSWVFHLKFWYAPAMSAEKNIPRWILLKIFPFPLQDALRNEHSTSLHFAGYHSNDLLVQQRVCREHDFVICVRDNHVHQSHFERYQVSIGSTGHDAEIDRDGRELGNASILQRGDRFACTTLHVRIILFVFVHFHIWASNDLIDLFAVACSGLRIWWILLLLSQSHRALWCSAHLYSWLTRYTFCCKWSHLIRHSHIFVVDFSSVEVGNRYFWRCNYLFWSSFPFWNCYSFCSISGKYCIRIWSILTKWFISRNGIAIRCAYNAVSRWW